MKYLPVLRGYHGKKYFIILIFNCLFEWHNHCCIFEHTSVYWSGMRKIENTLPKNNMQNGKTTKFIGLLVLTLLLRPSTALCETLIYYARYQIRTENGMIVQSSLELIPAQEEFRIEKFQRFRVSGTASGSNEIDAESAAIHDAVTKTAGNVRPAICQQPAPYGRIRMQ